MTLKDINKEIKKILRYCKENNRKITINNDESYEIELAEPHKKDGNKKGWGRSYGYPHKNEEVKT